LVLHERSYGEDPAEWELEAGSGLKTYVSDRVDLSKDEVIKLLTAENAQYVALGDVWTSELIRNTKDTDYDTVKPEGLLKIIIDAGSKPGDTVLDFFMGSGTTASVCLKSNRIFVGVEQLERGMTTLLERLSNVVIGCDRKGISKSVKWQGGGDFVYCELMKYNEAFMERIQGARSSEELVQIWREMAEDSFLNWYVNPAMPEEAVKISSPWARNPTGWKSKTSAGGTARQEPVVCESHGN